MLKNLFSKVTKYTISLGVILSFFEVYSAQAISLSFYLDGFQYGYRINSDKIYDDDSFYNNGFLRGEFHGQDKDNDGYITLDNIPPGYLDKTPDTGYIFMEYLYDYRSIINLNTLSSQSDYYFRYSILSNQLTGYGGGRYNGVNISETETCVWLYFQSRTCSNSPLVIQNLPDNNNPDNNSSTKVPEASLITALATFSLAVLLKGNKNSCFK